MIIQDIYLDDWDWTIKVFYAIDTYYIDDILGELESMGCFDLNITKELIMSGSYNIGITYSFPSSRYSVIVIGITTCPAEFQNTLLHEQWHLAMHIAERLEIDIYEEEFAYLIGQIGRGMFPVAKKFLCECCRKNLESGL